MINKALQIALKAHEGQLGEDGLPYILHPLRVMVKLTHTNEQQVAVLHDVIEDTDITIQDLKDAGFGEIILDALECITRRVEETYEDYISRVLTNSLASVVKLIDLEDNLARSDTHDSQQLHRIARYETAKIRIIQGR